VILSIYHEENEQDIIVNGQSLGFILPQLKSRKLITQVFFKQISANEKTANRIRKSLEL